MPTTIPVPATKLTYRDYVRLPNDGLRYELLDGEVVVSPAAGSPHQSVQMTLGTRLTTRIQDRGLGRVFGDLDCELAAHDVVRPDLLVVLPAHYKRITKTRVIGTPDLVIEILSPGNAARGRHEKRLRYQAAGTPELWLVDERRRTVTQFVHDGKRFAPGRRVKRSIALAILPNVVIQLHKVWPASGTD
ncbi:MAG: Uma2 family endonuclease [Planctomycetota bacterium]